MSEPVDSPQTGNRLLALRSVGVRFDGHPPVLQDVSFSMSRGEFVSIVGPSGCGKTTILRMIARLAEPTTGYVEVAGTPRTAFVFQEPNLLPWRTVVGNIRLPLELLAVPRTQQRAAVDESLRMIGLQEADRSKYPRMLSGGMKMRVSLARAMVTRPDILLLDEPFAALDDMLRQQLNEDLLQIWQTRGCTALFVTHNVAEAVFLSQRVLIMSTAPGRIMESQEIPLSYPRCPGVRGEAEFAKLTDRISRRLRGGTL
jgi:NitT/TauT family transport system ATP-binding protein